MKYMGSKARIVHEILPIMLDKEHDTFVDAFCGGCSVIENVPDTYRRIANDKNRYLIEMWKYLQNDGFVFNHISKTLYNFARDCYHGKNNFFTEAGVGLIGFMASFNGRFFDGGYSGHNVVGKNGKARDYIREQIENTMRDIPLLQGVEFYSGSYDELVIPDRSIVYCDLPYKATKKYDVSKNFDYERFYPAGVPPRRKTGGLTDFRYAVIINMYRSGCNTGRDTYTNFIYRAYKVCTMGHF